MQREEAERIVRVFLRRVVEPRNRARITKVCASYCYIRIIAEYTSFSRPTEASKLNVITVQALTKHIKSLADNRGMLRQKQYSLD